MTSDVELTKGRPENIRAVPVRHPWRWVAVAVIAVFVAMFIHMLVSNPNLNWPIVRQYLFSHIILRGVWMTIKLTILSMAIGIVLGTIAAVMRLSPNPVVSTVAWLYVWFFRGTPLLVQIIFWFVFSTFIRELSIGVPFGPHFWSKDTNSLITIFVSALLALSLNEGAYMSEIVRAGILSVDEGQSEAAQALGMTRLQVMRRVVLPQAMRVIVPPTGNETIAMIKDTSLVAAVPISAEAYYQLRAIGVAAFKVVPVLVGACLWYLALCSVLMVIQYYIERHFSKGYGRAEHAKLRLRGMAAEAGGGGGVV